MQLTKPVISPGFQSYAAPVAIPPVPGAMDKVMAGVRWVFDIDDGGGGLTCMVCVLAIFGVLVVRLAQLDRTLDSQTLNCKPTSQHSLQMECKFE